MAEEKPAGQRRPWNGLFSKKTRRDEESAESDEQRSRSKNPTWNMGMLNDRQTIEVPGSVLLLAQGRNEPLGLRNAPARTSHSSIPTGVPHEPPPPPPEDDKKMTKDGQIILEPQPDDSHNDPLNWASWRRDLALLSLGLYCMVGGGITPLIAAGFTNVAEDYNVPVARVSLTTGLYMMGLGIGSVLFSPTAILYGKRPVYLFSAVIFILSAVWCALSPNFTSLLIARIFQGIAVSPVECLPSATIAEIFFLHERAYRIGIYTLLLLGGKNLIPLVSAAIIQSLGWRWVFWIVALVVGFCGILLYFLVPETFWDRTPIPRDRTHPKRPGLFSRRSSRHVVPRLSQQESNRTPAAVDHDPEKAVEKMHEPADGTVSPNPRPKTTQHVGFAAEVGDGHHHHHHETPNELGIPRAAGASASNTGSQLQSNQQSALASRIVSGSATPAGGDTESERMSISNMPTTIGQMYTHTLRKSPPKSFSQHLRIYHGRLNQDKWWKAAVRPLILFSYPAVLWSSVVYACSIGWLIVISESVAIIYREGTYKFGALATGLVYLSPFIGGVLGTAVAGRVSDVIVKAMARRNGGLYEPEFRLVMAIPIAITTVIGLMGFGWSAGENDPWIVPTVFFGVVSFGCCLGSTTSITFCVDSYRQYAGEALVTLNFSKNVFHGLVFSLFVTEWLTHDGAKSVFIWIGVIQLICLLSTIPMYIYGKRARMWTVRKNMMEKF
ncbi:Major facilitator superfamily transporter [Apiospora arundinis]